MHVPRAQAALLPQPLCPVPCACAVGDSPLAAANSERGTLDWGPQEAVSILHDPMHPVPTIGGNITSGVAIMTGGAFDQV